MINELDKTHIENRSLGFISQIARLDLLVLDDFELMNLDPDKCRNLFELIDAREGRKSIIVVSQLPICSWYELFQDNTYVDACLGRMVARAYHLKFKGRNMRNPNPNS